MWTSSFVLLCTQIGLIVNAGMDCDVLKENFGNATSDFVSCAMQNTNSNIKPITLCENCVNSYIKIIKTYDDMKQSTDNGSKCIDNVINLDRLQIVKTLYMNSYNLWNDAKCYNCFKIVDGILTPNKSDDAVTFDKYYEKLNACISENKVDDKTLCTNCLGNYTHLNDFYHNISNENEKIATCMDMVDLMNRTRSIWSKKCCKYRRHDEYMFIISTTTVLTATFCFYLLAQFCYKKKNPTILQQRRFAESLNQASSSDQQ